MRSGTSTKTTLAALAAMFVLAFAPTAHATQVETTPEPETPPAAAPPPAPAAAPELAASPADTQEATKKKRKVGLAARFHGGLGQRRLFDDSVLGADLTGGLGLHIDNVNLFFDLQLLFGSTGGLPVRQYLIGPTFDVDVLPRFRIGAGLSLGGTSVTRATNDQVLTSFSVGVRGFLSVDVIELEERSAIYILGQLSLDSAGPLFESDSRSRSVHGTAVWGPTVAAGVRF